MKDLSKILEREISIDMKLGELLVLQQMCINELSAEDGENSFARTVYNLIEDVLGLEQYIRSFVDRRHED